MIEAVERPAGALTALRELRRELLIGGRWVPAAGDRRFEVVDPASERTICAVADASVEDGLAALEAASAAQGKWALVPAWERGAIPRRLYDELRGRVDELAPLISLESGKALSEARAELAYAIDGVPAAPVMTSPSGESP